MSSRASNSSSADSSEEFSRKHSLISSHLVHEEIEPYVRRKRSNSASDKSVERGKKRVDNLSEEEQNLLRTCINSRERRRMHDLNDALDDLRRVIPHSENSNLRKMSKIATVILATNWIRQLTTEIDQLKMQNGRFRNEISSPVTSIEKNVSPANTVMPFPDSCPKKRSSPLISGNLLIPPPTKKINYSRVPQPFLHVQQQQQQQQHQLLQTQQQFPLLPQFMATTFQNMAANAVFNANCRNHFQNCVSSPNSFDEKIKSALQLRQFLASTTAADLINNNKNIAPHFFSSIINKNKLPTASLLTSTAEGIHTKSDNVVADIVSQFEQSNPENNNNTISQGSADNLINELSSTNCCQQRHLMSPTSASTTACLCVACILSSKDNATNNLSMHEDQTTHNSNTQKMLDCVIESENTTHTVANNT